MTSLRCVATGGGGGGGGNGWGTHLAGGGGGGGMGRRSLALALSCRAARLRASLRAVSPDRSTSFACFFLARRAWVASLPCPRYITEWVASPGIAIGPDLATGLATGVARGLRSLFLHGGTESLPASDDPIESAGSDTGPSDESAERLGVRFA